MCVKPIPSWEMLHATAVHTCLQCFFYSHFITSITYFFDHGGGYSKPLSPHTAAVPLPVSTGATQTNAGPRGFRASGQAWGRGSLERVQKERGRSGWALFFCTHRLWTQGLQTHDGEEQLQTIPKNPTPEFFSPKRNSSPRFLSSKATPRARFLAYVAASEHLSEKYRLKTQTPML